MALDIDPQAITPIPDEEELAAILVAYEALWPRPSAATEPETPPRWRFAGRPWIRRAGYGGWR